MLQQFGDAVAGFRRDGQQLFDPQAAKFLRVGLELGVSILLTASNSGLPMRINWRASSRSGAASSVRPSTTITMASAWFERDASLAKNLRRNQRLVFGNDAAGVDHAQHLAGPFGFAVETITGDAGLVANDGAARPDQAVEERDLADVGAADDGQRAGNLGVRPSELWVRDSY